MIKELLLSGLVLFNSTISSVNTGSNDFNNGVNITSLSSSELNNYKAIPEELNAVGEKLIDVYNLEESIYQNGVSTHDTKYSSYGSTIQCFNSSFYRAGIYKSTLTSVEFKLFDVDYNVLKESTYTSISFSTFQTNLNDFIKANFTDYYGNYIDYTLNISITSSDFVTSYMEKSKFGFIFFTDDVTTFVSSCAIPTAAESYYSSDDNKLQILFTPYMIKSCFKKYDYINSSYINNTGQVFFDYGFLVNYTDIYNGYYIGSTYSNIVKNNTDNYYYFGGSYNDSSDSGIILAPNFQCILYGYLYSPTYAYNSRLYLRNLNSNSSTYDLYYYYFDNVSSIDEATLLWEQDGVTSTQLYSNSSSYRDNLSKLKYAYVNYRTPSSIDASGDSSDFRYRYVLSLGLYQDNNNDDGNNKIIINVIDITGLLFTIITLPFSFLSQAFNVTLFEGTAYAINLSNLLLGIVSLVLIFGIIKLLLGIIK